MPNENIQQYKVEFDCNSTIYEIDHNLLTEEKIHEINEFWMDHESRIDGSGSALAGVLSMLTRVILPMQAYYGWTTYGVIDEFDFKTGNGGIEGWPPLDGSYGIKLIRADGFEFDEDEMTFTKLGSPEPKKEA